MKLKLVAISFFLFCSWLNSFSQLNVQFNAINEYAFSSKEALNLTVINSTPKSFEIIIKGKINAADGQLIVEFTSSPVLLNIGANVLSPINVAIANQLYYNQDIAEIEAKTGTYPSGNCTICIWTTCVLQDCNGAGQYAGSVETPICTQVHVENPTPLLLALPENEAELEETRPLYSWIPPAPVAGSASLNYTMILVEMLEGQSKADALQLNRPLIESTNIVNPMLMHPSDLPALEEGKTYAWQVEAYVGRTSIGKSEQWKFKVKKEIPKKDTIKIAFIAKQQIGTEEYIVRSDSFKFKYLEQYQIETNSLMMYSIFNEANQLVNNFDESSNVFIQKGLNDYTLRIDFMGLNLEDGVYLLVIENAKKEKWYLRFRVSRNN